MRNTLRHAGASHLLVTVGFRTDDLALSVADDGRGFLPEGLGEQGSGHLGLLGMREAAERTGGGPESVRRLVGVVCEGLRSNGADR